MLKLQEIEEFLRIILQCSLSIIQNLRFSRNNQFQLLYLGVGVLYDFQNEVLWFILLWKSVFSQKYINFEIIFKFKNCSLKIC